MKKTFFVTATIALILTGKLYSMWDEQKAQLQEFEVSQQALRAVLHGPKGEDTVLHGPKGQDTVLHVHGPKGEDTVLHGPKGEDDTCY